MPIHEQRYRRYEAQEPRVPLRFWPITREALSALMRRRFLLPFLLLAWLPVVARATQIVVVAHAPEMGQLFPVGASLFGDFLGLQAYFALFLSALAGAGLVADDLRTGGILLYLSRALSRRDYVLGKLAVLAALNLSVTLAPALALYALALGLASDTFGRLGLAWLPLAIVAQGTLLTAVIALVALAASSLTQRPWIAGLGLVAGLVTLDLVAGTLRLVLDARLLGALSPLGALRLLADVLFGAAPHEAGQAGVALVALALVGGLALLVLRARVRAVEIAK